MQRLTPQEFYQQYFGRPATDKLFFVDPLMACEFAEQYAQHVEETAWVDVLERLPPPISKNTQYSEDVWVKTELGYLVSSYKYYNNQWKDGCDVIAWRSLPNPPQQ